ncbi:MAG: hypothetical protein IJA52_01670, partial [Clostridia bacterium]|nr:hypothetical protein [Clostridia bacterium]
MQSFIVGACIARPYIRTVAKNQEYRDFTGAKGKLSRASLRERERVLTVIFTCSLCPRRSEDLSINIFHREGGGFLCSG